MKMKQETRDWLLFLILRIIALILLGSVYIYLVKHWGYIISFFMNHTLSVPFSDLCSALIIPSPTNPERLVQRGFYVEYIFENFQHPAFNTNHLCGPCIPHTFEYMPEEQQQAYLAQKLWKDEFDIWLFKIVAGVVFGGVISYFIINGTGGTGGDPTIYL